MNSDALEKAACTPLALSAGGFNAQAVLPLGLTIEQIRLGMQDFLSFLGFVNTQLATKRLQRLESFLMPANFSSLVGEFMVAAIPKYCHSIVRNSYHNGHPDLLPRGTFPNNSIQHGPEGIEIKASRHTSGWQGHNAENAWLMVFVFDGNTSRDAM